jgi:hypothetical protein
LETRARTRRRPLVAAGLAAVMVAGVLATTAIAGADTTITSPHTTPGIGADNLVRDNSLTVKVNPGGFLFTRNTATAKYNYAAPAVSGLGLGCRGDLVDATPSHNFSPRSSVKITGPGGTILDQTSPVIDASVAGLLAGYPLAPAAAQTTPSATNFRGDVPPSGSNGATPPVYANPARGYTYNVDLTGKPAGVYTITTTVVNMTKGPGATACAVGTPVSDNTSTTGFGTTSVAGPKVESHTFEYRPWQYVFDDITSAGSISFNTNPAESQQSVGGATGAIVPGSMHFYALPGTDTFALPSDPTGCAADPGSCLPTGALSCDPAAGCQPRIVIIQRSDGAGESLSGVFDLETGAFIAAAKVDGHGRILLSLGDQGDTYYGQLIDALRTALAAQGFDVDHILGLGVELNNGHTSTKLTLLNGLQIDPSSGPSGIRLITDLNVQAGLLLNVFAQISPAACTTRTVTSAAGGNYDHDPNVGVGYTVRKSDLLIDAPTAAGLDALGVGGKVWHIEGDFQGPASPLLTPVRTETVLAGVDVSPGDAKNLITPEALLTAPLRTVSPRTMDFLGTATWTASETNIAGACLTVDFALGAGVAINNNPLPIGWGTLPIWAENANAASLTAAINAAIVSATTQVTTNPTVAALLEQILGAVPAGTVPVPIG